MKSFTILKKNRKYFAAMTDGAKCKIVIDDNSEELTIGTHDLDVDDISVRSKYGTDLIFKLTASVEEQKTTGICTLRHERYNELLIKDAHSLNGVWDKESKSWIFSGLIEEKVEELDEIYNSNLVDVEVCFEQGQSSGSSKNITFLGYPLAKASGRDSGAKLKEGFGIVHGGFTSGGSIANWKTIARAGTVIRMSVPELLLERELESLSKQVITVKRIKKVKAGEIPL